MKRYDLEELAVIDYELYDVLYVVGSPGIVGDEIPELRRLPVRIVYRGDKRRILEIVLGDV